MGAIKLRHDHLVRGLTDGLPEPIEGGGVRLGINVGLEQYDDQALADHLERIRATGIHYVKQTFHYGADREWVSADRILDAVDEQGLTLVPLLDGDPANGFAPPDDLESFARWASQFASRYGSQISHYIIWDEPNLSSHWGNQAANAADYAALLASAAAAIRASDPGAAIVMAPLAPTVESGPENLADPLFLQQMYEAGASDSFDLVSAKPYGFYTGPDNRNVSLGQLNFSRVILLREVMIRNGDGSKAIWAGNWGWNSLPDSWSGGASIWGETTISGQATQTLAALERASKEWPWMGVMFLENWQPSAPANDPRWGFSIAGRETEEALRDYLATRDSSVAMPGFHLAREDDSAQLYQGGWRFAPEYGADISDSGDSVAFTFWGTDLGIRVRRANFRARLYVTIDGVEANALPKDEHGSTLILTSADPREDYVNTEWVARNLDAGLHRAEVVASRGWDQWALNGFSVGYSPPGPSNQWPLAALILGFVVTALLAIREGRRLDWSARGAQLKRGFLGMSQLQQLALTAATAALVALAGWLTWGEQAAGMYRRLGDGSQLALTAAAASIFYLTPSFLVFGLALIALFILVTFRPAWGIALVAFSIPLYVLPKPILNYRFSPVEIFTLVTVAAVLLSRIMGSKLDNYARATRVSLAELRAKLHAADLAVLLFWLVATLSLLFTDRIDVATNEWRVVVMEPALFYLLLRAVRLKEGEMWIVLDSFVLGGFLVTAYGLGQFGTGEGLITAEGGLMRLRSFYGSPNNVALYLGRVLPILAAMVLFGHHGSKRRLSYGLMLVPVVLAFLLSFSKGGLFLGVPAAALFIIWRWLKGNDKRVWSWLLLFGGAGVMIILGAPQIPQVGERLDISGATGIFRLNLWRSSLNMIADHPWFGVGLDNFLYAYRGRYILDAAWQEPGLSHPHNLFLDLATRLGMLGLLAGSWLVWTLARTLRRLQMVSLRAWRPLAIGLGGALAYMVFHGLVDHALFLVDLSFAFHLHLGIAVWLEMKNQA
jgi:O-antigen ligase